jgi:hypothetical protein
MPRCVRNFWLEARIDGRQTWLSGGPRARDGGLYLTLYQRSSGVVEAALRVNCRADSNGGLLVNVYPCLPLASEDGIRMETRR